MTDETTDGTARSRESNGNDTIAELPSSTAAIPDWFNAKEARGAGVVTHNPSTREGVPDWFSDRTFEPTDPAEDPREAFDIGVDRSDRDEDRSEETADDDAEVDASSDSDTDAEAAADTGETMSPEEPVGAGAADEDELTTDDEAATAVEAPDDGDSTKGGRADAPSTDAEVTGTDAPDTSSGSEAAFDEMSETAESEQDGLLTRILEMLRLR